MAPSDAAELIGYLFACWGAGFVSGLTILAFRRFFETL
jgi:hypothetical protein